MARSPRRSPALALGAFCCSCGWVLGLDVDEISQPRSNTTAGSFTSAGTDGVAGHAPGGGSTATSGGATQTGGSALGGAPLGGAAGTTPTAGVGTVDPSPGGAGGDNGATLACTRPWCGNGSGEGDDACIDTTPVDSSTQWWGNGCHSGNRCRKVDLVWSGNDGGSVTWDVGDIDATMYRELSFAVRTTDDPFTGLRVALTDTLARTHELVPYVEGYASTVGAQWQTVTIPFDAFAEIDLKHVARVTVRLTSTVSGGQSLQFDDTSLVGMPCE